ncbi:MAG TPA: hypothetical protein DEO54_10565 [Rikenellaceae bacterium]|nr:MAG: hypothetical protein A2X20_06515 [Bacteroidetes bacterium GWE2_40_15]HBZ26652.1 hypothetical protein [Rikenellaceae bacterium]
MNKRMEDIKNKYIKREATNSEKELLFRHLDDNPQELSTFVKEEIDETFSAFPNEDAPENRVAQMMGSIRKKSFSYNFYKIAAILAIPLIGMVVYQYLHFTSKIESLENKAFSEVYIAPVQRGTTFEYTVNPGVKGLINLPDGSKVWLNSNSTLKCPQQFGNDKRELELSGEGYFQVESNPQWPMHIKTSAGYQVKVTGTEFNLSSYSNDKVLKLTMVSGTVTLISDRDKSELEVNKLQAIIVPVNSEIKSKDIVKANIHLNTGWKNGLLIFDNTPMDEVIKKMERWFGVKIIAEGQSVLNNRFTGEFDSESLIQVLEFMKITSNIKFSVKEKTYTLSEK